MVLGGLRHGGRRVFLLSQTHSSETTGLAACRATLEEYQRSAVDRHIWATGGRLVRRVRERACALGVADHVRIIGFDCNPQLLCTRADGSYWPELHTLFHEEVISWGVLIPWISITLAHGEQELDRTVDALEQGMRRVRAALEDDMVESAFEGPAVRPVFRPYNRCRQMRCGALDPTAPRLACCETSAESAS
jgi:glutamate-1-semialdehyde 2,1-aminomutase